MKRLPPRAVLTGRAGAAPVPRPRLAATPEMLAVEMLAVEMLAVERGRVFLPPDRWGTSSVGAS